MPGCLRGRYRDRDNVYLRVHDLSSISPEFRQRHGARVAENRSVAESFAIRVERLGGAESGGSCNAKTQLVGAKLEMVRAGWLLQHVDIVRRVCWLNRVDCVQRDEID